MSLATQSAAAVLAAEELKEYVETTGDEISITKLHTLIVGVWSEVIGTRNLIGAINSYSTGSDKSQRVEPL